MAEPREANGTVFTRNGMLDTNTGTRFAYGASSPIMARINNRVGVTRASNRAAFNEGNALSREARRNMLEALRRRS